MLILSARWSPARAARGSSAVHRAAWPTTSVRARRTALSTGSTGTAASSVDYRNAWPSACPAMVSRRIKHMESASQPPFLLQLNGQPGSVTAAALMETEGSWIRNWIFNSLLSEQERKERAVAELKNESLIANENSGGGWRIMLRLTARLYELLLLVLHRCCLVPLLLLLLLLLLLPPCFMMLPTSSNLLEPSTNCLIRVRIQVHERWYHWQFGTKWKLGSIFPADY